MGSGSISSRNSNRGGRGGGDRCSCSRSECFTFLKADLVQVTVFHVLFILSETHSTNACEQIDLRLRLLQELIGESQESNRYSITVQGTVFCH